MPDKLRLTDEQQRALGTYVKLLRATETTTTRLHRHLADFGLTTSQFGVLEALLNLGPLCQKDLGEKILKSSGNITLVIDNLSRRGLVTRERGTEDRRFITISLTEEGSRLVQALFPRHVEAVVGEMAVLTPSEQDELGRLCRKLGLQQKS